MKNAKTVKLMFRWSLLTSVLIAMVWGVWYFIEGSIPTLHYIRMTDSWTVSLPFIIPYYWSVLFGPIVSVLFVAALRNEKLTKPVEKDLGINVVLFGCTLIGIICGGMLSGLEILIAKLFIVGFVAQSIICFLGFTMIGLMRKSGLPLIVFTCIFFGSISVAGSIMCNVNCGLGALCGTILAMVASYGLVAFVKLNYQKFYRWIMVK